MSQAVAELQRALNEWTVEVYSFFPGKLPVKVDGTWSIETQEALTVVASYINVKLGEGKPSTSYNREVIAKAVSEQATANDASNLAFALNSFGLSWGIKRFSPGVRLSAEEIARLGEPKSSFFGTAIIALGGWWLLKQLFARRR